MSQMFRRACSIAFLPLDQLGLAAERRDPLLRLAAEAVGVDRERLGELAVGQHLEPVAQLLQDALAHEQLRRHDRAGLEHLEPPEVDAGELLAERRVGEAALRDAPVQRHLAALEAGLAREAAAALLALLAAPGRLAEPAARTAAHALPVPDAALRRLEIVKTHLLVSAPATRPPQPGAGPC